MGEAADGSAVLAVVAEHKPDVVLMGVRMPGLDGLAATELLRGSPDPPEVILLTAFHVDEYVLRALRAGAVGFVLKDTPPADILHAVERVAAGEPFLSPAVLRQLLTHLDGASATGRRDYARSVLSRPSDRERAVAVALSQGKSNAEISRELFLRSRP